MDRSGMRIGVIIMCTSLAPRGLSNDVGFSMGVASNRI